MENKFTLRDFLVYLLTGFSVVIFYLPLMFKESIQTFKENQALFKDFSATFVIFLLLAFYLIGHIIQSVDLMRYFIVKKLLHKMSVSDSNKFKRFFVGFLANNRVIGVLHFEGKIHSEFQKKVYTLQAQGKFSGSEYWYSLKDLFHGLEIVALGFTIWAFFLEKYIFLFIYFFIAISFWLEARFYSKEYVESVEFSFEANKEKV